MTEQAKNTFIVIFSSRLRKAMNSNNLTQSALADAVGIRQTSVSDYLNGKTIPSADVFYRLSVALGVSMNWLLGESETEHAAMFQEPASFPEQKLEQIADILRLLGEINSKLSKFTRSK